MAGAKTSVQSFSRHAGCHNYRHKNDASVGTNVISSLLTAVAFLCFPTYFNMFAADNA